MKDEKKLAKQVAVLLNINDLAGDMFEDGLNDYPEGKCPCHRMDELNSFLADQWEMGRQVAANYDDFDDPVMDAWIGSDVVCLGANRTALSDYGQEEKEEDFRYMVSATFTGLYLHEQYMLTDALHTALKKIMENRGRAWILAQDNLNI